MPQAAKTAPPATEVAAFLRAHPGFLTAHPELYSVLTPPKRVHGEAMADHMAAMLAAARADRSAVVDSRRAADGMALRVQEAVLALFASDDIAETIAADFPALLGIDAATLCAETPMGSARLLPQGTTARIMEGRPVLLRPGTSDAPTLHGEAARLAGYEALIRLPLREPALLALVARDPLALDPAQGSAPLAFLGRAVAAALKR